MSEPRSELRHAPQGTKVARSWDAEWVERNTGRTLNDDQARCIDTLCSFIKPYNLPLINNGWRGTVSAGDAGDDTWTDDDEAPFVAPVVFGTNYLVTHIRADLATHDFPELTRLVIAAHQHAVRVGISSAFYRYISTDDEKMTGPAACLRLMLHARTTPTATFGSGTRRSDPPRSAPGRLISAVMSVRRTCDHPPPGPNRRVGPPARGPEPAQGP